MSSLLEKGLRAHFSEEELTRLASVRVGIAGAGGLGSNVAMLLARSGIRKLRIVDGDLVEASNLNRQCYWPEDVGQAKTDALHRRLLALDPGLDVEAQREWLVPEDAAVFFQGCAIVVECLDKAAFKAELCASLLSGNFFVVAASGIGGYGLPPMELRRLGGRFVCVGDFVTEADAEAPPLGPRVAQAAALQADAVVTELLRKPGLR